MKPHIDFKECLKDSPKFRESLDEAESNIELLESRMDKLVKLCGTMIETGKIYNNATHGFVSGVRDMAAYFEEDEMTHSCLTKFASAMTEMQKYYSILLDQAYRSVCKNLTDFIRTDIRKVKENRKHFEKISDDMDAALYKNSQTPRSKAQECDETHNVMTAMRSCFHHTALDYVFRINVLHSEKRFGVLETILSFMHAQNTYFHQGNDLFCDLESYMKSIAAEVEDLTAKAAIERKQMEDRHSLVQTKELQDSVMTIQLEDNGVPIEGYLFKRTSNAFKSWVRRWFSVQDKQLVYRKRSRDSVTVMEEDLRLCHVRPVFDTERRCCFEIVSPVRVHMLQADSDVECMAWINAIQSAVNKAFTDTQLSLSEEDDSTPTTPVHQPNSHGEGETTAPKQSKSQLRRQQLLSIPGNSVCCDCQSESPSWASINLGITLCIECSGIHRSLGVHFSKVRSITLDVWEPELLKVMVEMGNDIVNKIYEARLDEGIAVKATPACTREVREKWIRTKYVERAFVTKLPGADAKSASNTSKIRSWSVCRKTRKSPSRMAVKPLQTLAIQEDCSSDDVSAGLMEAVLSVSTPTPTTQTTQTTTAPTTYTNDDSGFETTAADVLVFGTEARNPDLTRSFDLDSSEDSLDEDEDATSTTSWEDVSKLEPDTLLYKAAQARNLPVMLEALAHRATVNWKNGDDAGKTPLIKAVETGSLAACEFLLLNGASLDKGDNSGRTPLHHATRLGHTGQVCQFLKRGARQNALDNDGLDPLSIAVNAANADIVTLLRLAKLNEEMKETEGVYQQGDDTFNDVFRDFSNMASNNPEKLIRK